MSALGVGARAPWIAGDVARAWGAEVLGDASAVFDTVTTDSREVRAGAAFFALAGSRHRGADFVPAAFGSGCSVAVVPWEWSGAVPPGRCALRVPDPLRALAALAKARRDAWSCPVLAVTGSAGKTSVKEMTAHVFAADRRVLRTPGNWNTTLGISRTILDAADEPDLAVLECGASEPGEIARLATLASPTAACVTNVGAAHLAGFGSIGRVRAEKLDLVRAVRGDGPRILDTDDPAMAEAARSLGGRIVRVGRGADADVRLAECAPREDGGSDYRLADGTRGTLSVPGEHQVRNALFAIAFAEAHGVRRAEAAARLASFGGVPGRLAVRAAGGVTIADDTYNANPASMSAALAWFARLPVPGRKAVALGDMLELGEDSARHHAALGREVAALGFDRVVFAGDEMAAAFAAAAGARPAAARHVGSSAAAAEDLAAWVRAGDAVLVKGSRGMRMERVVEALAAREDSGAR